MEEREKLIVYLTYVYVSMFFPLQLGGSDSTDFSEDSKPKRRGYSSNPASSDLIASYSTNTGGEPTVKTTYSSHAHPAPSSSNTKSHIAAPPSGPSPNGRGRGVAKSADLSTHTTKTPPRSPSRKGGVVSGRGANGLRNQSSSRENLLSSSRENVVEDFSPPSQGSEVTEGRGSEEEGTIIVELVLKGFLDILKETPSYYRMLKLCYLHTASVSSYLRSNPCNTD